MPYDEIILEIIKDGQKKIEHILKPPIWHIRRENR